MSLDLQKPCTEVPWQKVIGMRHRLIHAYYDINRDVLWSTIAEDLPPLAAQPEAMLDEESR